MSYLRYRRGTKYGDQYPTIRYPSRRDVTPEQAEQMRQAMPNPDAFEIIESED